MAQQLRQQVKKTAGVLIKCNFCGHVWLTRSSLSFVTCGACRNHVKVKYNIVTSDVLSENKESNPGPEIPQSKARIASNLVVEGGPL